MKSSTPFPAPQATRPLPPPRSARSRALPLPPPSGDPRQAPRARAGPGRAPRSARPHRPLPPGKGRRRPLPSPPLPSGRGQPPPPQGQGEGRGAARHAPLPRVELRLLPSLPDESHGAAWPGCHPARTSGGRGEPHRPRSLPGRPRSARPFIPAGLGPGFCVGAGAHAAPGVMGQLKAAGLACLEVNLPQAGGGPAELPCSPTSSP